MILPAEDGIHALEFGSRHQRHKLVHEDEEADGKDNVHRRDPTANFELLLCRARWRCNSSRATLPENFRARKPSVIAWPSVITPRSTGQAIQGCFSERRSSGSLWVTISPDGLRQAMRPGMRRAHHNAFEHGLAADQRFLAAFSPAGRKAGPPPGNATLSLESA